MSSANCPTCGRMVKVNKNGRFRRHKRHVYKFGERWVWVPCPGSRQKAPKEGGER